MKVDIDVSEIEALIKKLPAFEKIIFDEMASTMQGSLAIFQEKVVGATPVGATGNLRGSIIPMVHGEPPAFEGELATSLIYGEPVERGRRAGRMPPVDAIEIWVRRVLGVTGDESRGIAFVIARNIGQFGTEGAFMFEEGFETGLNPVMKLWEDLPPRAVRKIDRKI